MAVLLPVPTPAAHFVARGTLPADRLHFGLANGPGAELDWMTASGIPWHYRYQYLAGGINTGPTTGDPSCGPNAGWQTWDSPAGQFVTNYISDSVARAAIPVFTYYEIVQSNPSPGSEGAELTKISTTCTMQAYWADFTVLMQKVGAYGGLVVVHVEPDFWGFMEHQSADPSTLAAVVASSGNPDLAGLPNTVQGMGLAFLKLRDKYAPNALLAIHASSWGSGVDIATDHRTTVDPAVEADAVASFIEKAGIVGNPGGITPWDVVFNDVADHDAAWYGALSNDHWWDRSNVVFPNFTRWLAFMSRLHADTGLPLVEWQVPVGNQYFDTMNNTDGHYQDNRAEYFLAHPTQLTAAGIVAVLFGAGNAGQTSYMDAKGDGITNPAPVSSWQCSLCNNHVSTVADDDGGFLRMAVGAYYGSAPSLPCTTPNLGGSPVSPGATGGSVLFTASTSACPNPRYRFWVGRSGAWTMVQDYSAANTFTWNATGLAGTYGIEVDVRDSSSSLPYQAVRNIAYSLNACTAAGIGAGPSSPQLPGATITVSGSGTCPGTPTFRFWVGQGGAWTIGQDYGTSNTFNWNTTGKAQGSYGLEVDVRDQGATAAYEKVANTTFQLGLGPCSTPTLSANPISPGPTGGSVLFTATTSGCASPTYRFWVGQGGAWRILQDYSPTSTFTWTGTGAAGTYGIEVDVRAGGETVAYDHVRNITYALTGCTFARLAPDKTSPQSRGTTIVLTGSATCAGTPQYRFWVRDATGHWAIAQDYGASNTFSWNTTGLPAGTYGLEVDVRNQGSTATYETVANLTFGVT
jgi:hypothetical protein